MKEDIFCFAREDKSSPLFVSMCGISYCDGSYIIDRVNSEVNVMEYIISGSGTVNEDDITFTASEGDIYFLKKGRHHIYYSDDKNPWTKIWFNFDGKLAQDITECYSLSNIPHFHAPELKKYFDEIYNISKSGAESNAVSKKITVLFLRLAQILSDSNQEEKRIYSELSTRIKNSLDSISDFSVTLDEIVSQLYCSKNHAIREFKRAYHITPYEYLLNKRFEMAKSMLKNTFVPISEISERLAFCDVHYFSNCFKKRFGISPRAYRKNGIIT